LLKNIVLLQQKSLYTTILNCYVNYKNRDLNIRLQFFRRDIDEYSFR